MWDYENHCTRKTTLLDRAPLGVFTRTVPVVAPFGTVATISVAETIVNDPQHGGDATAFTFVTGPKVGGTGKGNIGGQITFNAFLQLQRPGLLLQDNAIYTAFASHGDIGAYHGWVLAFDAGNLSLIATYCTTPDWGEGGIW